MSTINRKLMWLHRWTGILFAGVFVVVALTGSLLTFRFEIQQMMYPDALNDPLPANQQANFSGVAERVSQTLPGSRVAFMQTNQANPDFPIRMIVQSAKGDYQVMYAGKRGERLIRQDIDEGFWRTMRNLHIFLLAAMPGLLVVFASGWVLILCSAIGIWLWWPKLKKPKIAFGIRWRSHIKKVLVDIHNAMGVYFLLPVILLSLTGCTLILSRLNPTALPKPEVSVQYEQYPASETLARALNTIGYAEGEITVNQIQFPGPDAPYFTFDVYDAGEGYATLYLDQQGGDVLLATAERDLSLWARLKGELGVAIHEGHILGNTGRWLVFISGIVLSIGTFTGIWLWLKRRKPRSKKS